jgi:hypothetical protein
MVSLLKKEVRKMKSLFTLLVAVLMVLGFTMAGFVQAQGATTGS